MIFVILVIVVVIITRQEDVVEVEDGLRPVVQLHALLLGG